MPETKDILASMGVDLDTKRFELKLRAIAKHAEALADELNAIDNDWKCEDCGSYSYATMIAEDVVAFRACAECGKPVELDELPTRIEGST